MHERDGLLRCQVSGSGGPSRTSLWWRTAASLLGRRRGGLAEQLVPTILR